MIRLSYGKRNSLVIKEKCHYHGWKAGVNLARTEHELRVGFKDPFGTEYIEKKGTTTFDWGIQADLFYMLPLYRQLYITGEAGLSLSPNISNPLDNAFPGYDELPFYSPAGGTFAVINLHCAIGLHCKFANRKPAY